MNEITEAIVLAGGLGQRLRHVVNDTQKAMAPVNGMPFLHYVLYYLSQNGVRHVVLAVSYFADHVKGYFGETYLNMDISYSFEPTPMGTGGALRLALEKCRQKNCFLLNGDTFFNVDLRKLAENHASKHADVTLSVKQMHGFSRYGRVEFDITGRVKRFAEKQYTEHGFINGGVYAVNTDIKHLLPTEKCSFEKQILEHKQIKEFVFESQGYFIDIGVASDYFLSQTELPLSLGQHTFKAAFLDRDGVICAEKNHLYRTDDFAFIPGVERALAQLKAQGYLIIAVTNQAGVAKGLFTESDVRHLHEYMINALQDKASIDAVYYCPYHPNASVEAYRRDSVDRKPNPGMIFRAVEDFKEKGINIDLANSLIVGDTERDIQTGINAGIGLKVLVRSGHSIPDEAQSKADIICDSLPDFVNNYIVKDCYHG